MARRLVVLAGMLTVVVLAGCMTGRPVDGRYPGDDSACDDLPVYERRECREQYPPIHDPIEMPVRVPAD